ncbi:unnamed protein product, partial [Phaeothamnion confervicola]
VERSPNGKDFNPVAKITGSGTTNEQHTYLASDNFPYVGISYYRLMQQDFDKSINYSKIISVQVKANEQHRASIFPDPAIKRDELYIRCYNQIDEIVTINYIDSKGMSVRSESFNLVTGYNEVRLSPDFKTGGVYILILKTHAGLKTFRIAVP